jgi:hypothetical protein
MKVALSLAGWVAALTAFAGGGLSAPLFAAQGAAASAYTAPRVEEMHAFSLLRLQSCDVVGATKTSVETALLSSRGEKLPTERWRSDRTFSVLLRCRVASTVYLAPIGGRRAGRASLVIEHVRLQI